MSRYEIWSNRAKTTAEIKYEQTGDPSWIELFPKPREFIIRKATPFMINNLGQVVCLPEDKDTSTIGVFGTKGSGKSLMSHTILDRKFWYQHYCCVAMNDMYGETGDWSKPQGVISWCNKLATLKETPMPLPIVFVGLSNESYLTKTEEYSNLKISIEYEEFIKHIDNYIDLGQSLDYFKNLEPQLLALNEGNMEGKGDIKAYEDVITKGITNKKMIGVIDKLKIKVGTFIKQNITDFNTDAVSKIIVEKDGEFQETYFPIPALLRAGLFVSVNTSNIIFKDYFPCYFKTMLEDIYRNQLNGSWFHKTNQRVIIFVDELPMIAGRDKKSVAEDMISTCVMQGRPARFELMYATQIADKVPDKIINNTKVAITMCNTKDNIDVLKRIFNLTHHQEEEIMELDKFNYECMAMTKERFLIYDPMVNKYFYTDNTQKGRMLMPLSHHKKP